MINTTLSVEEILKNLSIARLNPMQREMGSVFSENTDIMLLSPTGSGKTLGFLLPILGILQPNLHKVQALILVPSRELALQIEEVFKSMKTPFKVNCCYGGHEMKIERNNLSNPPAVLIGTPGRLADHLDKGTFETDAIATIVFDEFDKSLEFGFTDDMAYIVGKLPKLQKRILISATNAIDIPQFVGIKEYKQLNYLPANKQTQGLDIKVVLSEDVDKLDVFLRLICTLDGQEPCIVFCNHRDAVDRLGAHLAEYKIVSECFHGGLDQKDREETLAKFRNGSTHILVTTDLAARGLDIPEIRNIIHYQKPNNEETFIHRNGRTARMGKEGCAYLILSESEPYPDYLHKKTEKIKLPDTLVIPDLPKWVSLFIGKGKKDKVNKMDIVGFLSKVAQLEKEEIGLIEVKDFFSYVAISRSKAPKVIKLVVGQKIKNQTAKILLA